MKPRGPFIVVEPLRIERSLPLTEYLGGKVLVSRLVWCAYYLTGRSSSSRCWCGQSGAIVSRRVSNRRGRASLLFRVTLNRSMIRVCITAFRRLSSVLAGKKIFQRRLLYCHVLRTLVYACAVRVGKVVRLCLHSGKSGGAKAPPATPLVLPLIYRCDNHTHTPQSSYTEISTEILYSSSIC